MATTSAEVRLILDGDADAIARALDLHRPGGHCSGRIYISRSTSRRKEWSCRLCDRLVASCSNDYPVTRRAVDSIASHDCEPTSDQIDRAIVARVRWEAEIEEATAALGWVAALGCALVACAQNRVDPTVPERDRLVRVDALHRLGHDTRDEQDFTTRLRHAERYGVELWHDLVRSERKRRARRRRREAA